MDADFKLVRISSRAARTSKMIMEADFSWLPIRIRFKNLTIIPETKAVTKAAVRKNLTLIYEIPRNATIMSKSCGNSPQPPVVTVNILTGFE